MGRTNLISDVESLVIGPKSVVYTWFPALISTNNVVSGGDSGDAEQAEEEKGGGAVDEAK